MIFTPSEIAAYIRVRFPDINMNQGRNQIRCPCPIHHGTHDNFSLQTNTGLCCCHSQCRGKDGRPAGGDLIWLEQQLHGGTFPEASARVFEIIGGHYGRPQQASWRPQVLKPQPREVARYPYEDLTGPILFYVIRYADPKCFTVRQPDGTRHIRGVKRVPYRLREMIAGGEDVIIVEGEKAVDALRAAGFNASCNPFGAGNFTPGLVPYFAGKQVMILPDHDEPGREHARKVQRLLLDARILDLHAEDSKPASGPDDFLVQFGVDVLREKLRGVTV